MIKRFVGRRELATQKKVEIGRGRRCLTGHINHEQGEETYFKHLPREERERSGAAVLRQKEEDVITGCFASTHPSGASKRGRAARH